MMIDQSSIPVESSLPVARTYIDYSRGIYGKTNSSCMGTARYKMFLMYKYLYYKIIILYVVQKYIVWYIIIYTVGTLQVVACEYNVNNIVLLSTFSASFLILLLFNILLLCYNSGVYIPYYIIYIV